MLEPCTAWLPQFCRTRVRSEWPPSGTLAGLNANCWTETPPVQPAVVAAFAAFGAFAAFAAPGANNPASGTTAARTDINSLRSMAGSPSPGRCGHRAKGQRRRAAVIHKGTAIPDAGARGQTGTARARGLHLSCRATDGSERLVSDQPVVTRSAPAGGGTG